MSNFIKQKEEGRNDKHKACIIGYFLFCHDRGDFRSGIATAADDIRIGFTPPITGQHAAAGSLQVKAIKLALKEINAAGGVNGKKIDLRIIDSQSTNPGALAALQKAVDQEKVVALIGCLYSTQVLATSDAIKNYGIPTIIGATNVSITKQGNPWLFRVRPDDSIAAGAMVRYIKENTKLTKIGLLHDADAMGTGGADLVEKGAKEAGLTIVRREKIATAAKDFTAELLAMKNAGAEILVFYGHQEATALLQRQVRQLGSPFKFLGSPSAASKDSLNLAKEAAGRDLGRGGLRAGTDRGEQALRRGLQERVQRGVRHPQRVDL